jgi:hypothetical protein
MDKLDLRKQLEEFIVETENCAEICKTKYSHIDGALKLSRKFLAEKKFLTTVSDLFIFLFNKAPN